VLTIVVLFLLVIFC